MVRSFMHRATHGSLTAVITWLALKFLDNEDTFATNHSFDWMAGVMSEVHWGLVFGAFGCAGWITLFATSWKVRTASAGMLSFCHAGLSCMLYLGNPNGTGVGTYFLIAIQAACLAYSSAHMGARFADSVEPSGPTGQLAGGGIGSPVRGDRLGDNSVE